VRKIEQELAANASLEAINLQRWTDGPHQSQEYNGSHCVTACCGHGLVPAFGGISPT